MPPERSEVRAWLLKARSDWSAARKIFASRGPELDVVAFHAQQAVEKLLKAYLIQRGIEFEKIHDLSRLVEQCAEDDRTFEGLQDAVEPLSQYAVVFRYPCPADLPRAAVERALLVVEQVWQFVAQRFPAEEVPSILQEQ